MAVGDTYQDVKSKAIGLRKKILNKIFDSRFDSMLDAIAKSGDISKTIGNAISMSSTKFSVFGSPMKIGHIAGTYPTLYSTNNYIITPKWNGDTTTVRVNNTNVDLITIPELMLEPAEIKEIGAKIGKSLGYSVYIYEDYKDGHASIYDVYDWKYGYILPTSILHVGYYRYEMTGSVSAPVPIDITTMLASVYPDKVIKDAYYRCWNADGYYIEFNKPDVLKVMCIIFTDCNIALYPIDDPITKATTIYAPVIAVVFYISGASGFRLKITNVGELEITDDILYDTFAFFGAYSPFLNRVKIGENVEIWAMSGSC